MPRSIAEMLEISKKKHEKEVQDTVARRRRASWFVRNAKWLLIVFANLVALTFDALAVTTVYSLTAGDVLFSSLSLLPTGVPMILWELAWMNPLSSRDQKSRAVRGMVASVLSAIVVGTLAVLAIELPTANNVLAIVLLLWCVGAVIFHGLEAAQYFYKDPVIEREHILQTTISEQEFQKDTILHGRSVLETIRKGLADEKDLRDEYGDAAVDRWLGIVLGDDENGKPLAERRPLPTHSPDVLATRPLPPERDNHREPDPTPRQYQPK